MTKITINKLTLRQFKGVDDFTANLNGSSATIYGMNGKGKSTLADAYLWTLTGKNNAGETFDPFPVDEAGNRKHDGQQPTVEIEFVGADGETFALKRSLVEKRVKKSGYAESVYTGDETKCWIDGVPKKIGEYNAFVERTFATDNVLRLLTCTGYFNQQIKKADERRALLFQTFGDMQDCEILESTPELSELQAAAGKKTVDDFLRQMKAEHAETCKQLDLIPVRIDEAAKSLVDGIDVAAATSAISKIGVELATLKYEVNNNRDNTADHLRYEIQREKQAIDREELRFKDYLEAEAAKIYSKYKADKQAAQSAVRYSISDLVALRADIARGEKRVAQLEEAIQAERDNWNRVSAEDFNADTVCPTCGQDFPESHIEEMRQIWNEQKSARLSNITESGKSFGAELDKCNAALTNLRKRLAEAERIHEETEAKLKEIGTACTPFKPSDEMVVGHNDVVAAHSHTIHELESKLAEIEQGDNPDHEAKQQRIAELERQQAEQQELIARFKAGEEAQQRIDQYSAEQVRLGDVRDHTAKMIQLCEDFVRIKAEKVTHNINRHFKIVRFVLFENQKNGGLRQICEATVDGVSFDQMNRARQVAAALDVIATFGNALGLSFPVFIDDSEGIHETYGVSLGDTQRIKLIATEDDRELRVEV